jgi:EAL domain-containing protein (putative c-di-GMP-specific phosphodiesterase class I)
VDGFKMAGDLVHVDDAGSRTARLAAAIVALGESLDMATVAEGIETSAQAERMRALGCTFGQGSFFARPLTANEIDQGFEGLATDHRWRPEGLALHALPRRAPRAIAVSHPDAA